MKYYSTNKNTPSVSLKEAVAKGLAADVWINVVSPDQGSI